MNDWTIPIGLSVIVGALWAYEAYEASAASRQQQGVATAYADTTLYAQLGQQAEETTIPAGGELPSNPITEALPGTSVLGAGQSNTLILAAGKALQGVSMGNSFGLIPSTGPGVGL